MKTRTRLMTIASVSAIAAAIWVTQAHPVAPSFERLASETVALSPAPGLITWREYLATYWGSKWPEFELQLSAEQAPILEQSIDPTSIPTWGTIEPLIRSELWDSLQSSRERILNDAAAHDTTLDLEVDRINPLQKDLSASHRDAIQVILDRDVAAVAELRALAFDLRCEAEDSVWSKGSYRAFPLIEFNTGLAKLGRGALSSTRRLSRSNWVVSYEIDSADFPELDRVIRAIDSLQQQRAREVSDYVSGL